MFATEFSVAPLPLKILQENAVEQMPTEAGCGSGQKELVRRSTVISLFKILMA